MDIKHCPFCGCMHPRIEVEGVCDFYFYVRCPICGARTRSEYTEEEAKQNWNRRTN